MTNLIRFSTGMPKYSSGHLVPTVGLLDDCQIDHCGKHAAEGVGIKLCLNHLRKAYAAYMIISETDGDIAFREAPKMRDVHSKDASGYVYFARVRDVIKIGWTHNVQLRMYQLKPDALLHTMPGTRNDESALHALFGAYLVRGREWFSPAPELMAYIRGLQSKAS